MSIYLGNKHTYIQRGMDELIFFHKEKDKGFIAESSHGSWHFYKQGAGFMKIFDYVMFEDSPPPPSEE